jgi:hypothetical protein
MVQRGLQDERLDDERRRITFAPRPAVLFPAQYDIPTVTLSEDQTMLLVCDRWTYRCGKDGKGIAPGAALLGLARLSTAREQPERILRYAEIYGPLDVCEHSQAEWPFPFMWPGWRKLSWQECEHCQGPVREECEHCPRPVWREPIEQWIHFAEEADIVLRLHCALRLLKASDPNEPAVDLRNELRFIERLPKVTVSDLETVTAEELSREVEARLEERMLDWIDSADRVRDNLEVATPRWNRETYRWVAARSLAGQLVLDLDALHSTRMRIARCREPGCYEIVERKGRGPAGRCEEHAQLAARQKRSKWYYKTHPEAKGPRKYEFDDL